MTAAWWFVLAAFLFGMWWLFRAAERVAARRVPGARRPTIRMQSQVRGGWIR